MISLQEKVGHLPQSPGVYQFRDAGDQLLYVGKAKRLRARVKSYFQESRNHDGRIKLMISKIHDVEVIVTDSEAEALILENTLIKKHHPRYNVMYRDDKSYPYICLTKDERPRVFPTRTVKRDGSRYFGPYDHVGHMKRMLETIRTTFNLCTCAVTSKTVDHSKRVQRWRACFEDYVGTCSGDMPVDQYRAIMGHVERMLNGKTEELARELRKEMEIASDALEFEQAAKLRDAIESLHKYNRKMKVVADTEAHRDLFALSVDQDIGEGVGVIFRIREGKLIGKFHRFLRNIDGMSQGELLQAFMEDYYTDNQSGGGDAIPDEVYVSEELPDADALLQFLWQEHGSKVPIHEPKIGEKKQLISMAESNANLILGERRLEKERMEQQKIPQSVKDLQEYLKLRRLPRRIECFDNSNIQGSDPVASMVCFVDARPRKSEYKKFHIKTVTGADDYASMKEVITRRYRRVRQEGQQIPDLIVIDGGKGQLNAAIDALREIDFFGECDIVGLAKRLEEVFLPGKSDPVMIPKTSSALKLIQKARDEAHRFAITFHKQKRSKRTIKTELTTIPGIGVKRAGALIQEFGSVKKVSEATLDELRRFTGSKTAQAIYDHFHP